MAYKSCCDECGQPSKGLIHLATGRVLKDGKDIGQTMDFCWDHTPEGKPVQPKNCQHIEFIWPRERKKPNSE